MRSVPATRRSSSRCSGQGSTWRRTASRPSSVSTSRTADENGHHSAWYRVSIQGSIVGGRRYPAIMATMEHPPQVGTDTIEVLDHGFVRLDAAMADDPSV